MRGQRGRLVGKCGNKGARRGSARRRPWQRCGASAPLSAAPPHQAAALEAAISCRHPSALSVARPLDRRTAWFTAVGVFEYAWLSGAEPNPGKPLEPDSIRVRCVYTAHSPVQAVGWLALARAVPRCARGPCCAALPGLHTLTNGIPWLPTAAGA